MYHTIYLIKYVFIDIERVRLVVQQQRGLFWLVRKPQPSMRMRRLPTQLTRAMILSGAKKVSVGAALLFCYFYFGQATLLMNIFENY
jgi:hypothetical protein